MAARERRGTLLTLEQAARVFGVPRATLYRWVHDGKLPGRKYSPAESEEPLPGRGVRWYVDEEEVERFLGRQLDPLDLPQYAKEELVEAKRTVNRAIRDAEAHNGMLSTTTLLQLGELVDRLDALAASSLLAE